MMKVFLVLTILSTSLLANAFERDCREEAHRWIMINTGMPHHESERRAEEFCAHPFARVECLPEAKAFALSHMQFPNEIRASHEALKICEVPHEHHQPYPHPVPPPPPRIEMNSVYRFNHRGEHFQTLSFEEGRDVFRGVPEGSFKLFAVQYPHTHGLFRCITINSHRHFMSIDQGCEGEINEGVLGFAFDSARDNTSQLFRCRVPNGSDHLTTVGTSECINAGLIVEQAQGFIPTL